jgi:hypothetical protein
MVVVRPCSCPASDKLGRGAHPRQHIEARQSLPARSIRAGSMGRACEGETEQMGRPRPQAADRGCQKSGYITTCSPSRSPTSSRASPGVLLLMVEPSRRASFNSRDHFARSRAAALDRLSRCQLYNEGDHAAVWEIHPLDGSSGLKKYGFLGAGVLLMRLTRQWGTGFAFLAILLNVPPPPELVVGHQRFPTTQRIQLGIPTHQYPSQ